MKIIIDKAEAREIYTLACKHEGWDVGDGDPREVYNWTASRQGTNGGLEKAISEWLSSDENSYTLTIAKAVEESYLETSCDCDYECDCHTYTNRPD